MKTMHLFKLVLLFMLITGFTSCNNDTVTTIPPINNLSFNGEGGARSVTFGDDNWEITGIENIKGGSIFGNIYDDDDNLLKENVELKLTDTGRLKAEWLNKGFTISRIAPKRMDIDVIENTSGDDFGFVIYLRSGEQTEKISVYQEPSPGYEFDRIEYTLIPESQINIWNKGISYEFNYSTNIPDTIKCNPMENIKDCLLFECSSPQAFTWMEEGRIEVLVPNSAYKNELLYSSEKVPYQNKMISLPPNFPVEEYAIIPPAGISKCHFEIEYIEFKASYRLYIKNKSNQNVKTYDGLLTRKYPTGSFRIIWD